MNDSPATSPSAKLRTERDRFVAMAFCWADVLIECDADEKVVFGGVGEEFGCSFRAQTFIRESK